MEIENTILKHRGGFTLIELLTVVAIIGILSAIAMTSLNGAKARARDTKRKAETEEIHKALELYYLDHGEYPASGGSTAAFQNTGWTNSGNASWDTLQAALAPYMAELPEDPVNDAALFRRTYNYYSRGYGCDKQWFMLIYGLESQAAPAATPINHCPGASTSLTYHNAVVVQECKGC